MKSNSIASYVKENHSSQAHAERDCSKFCNGAKNTNDGIVAVGLHVDIANDFRLTSKSEGYPCPIGCTSNPTSSEAAQNIGKNGGAFNICHKNAYRNIAIIRQGLNR